MALRGNKEATERVIMLLRTYQEALTSYGSQGDGSWTGDSRLHLLPELWHQGSYAELERTLIQLRAENPYLYKFLKARYLTSETRVKDVSVKVMTKKGMKRIMQQQVVEVYPDWVDQGEGLRDALAWVTDRMYRRHGLDEARRVSRIVVPAAFFHEKAA